MADPRHRLGSQGERLAERYLKRQGLRIIARGYDTPVGEIDLIAREDGVLVFVEVKTRSDRNLADPQDAVNREKRRRLLRAAQWYRHRKRCEDQPCRYDIVAIVLPADSEPEIEHFRDAFLPDA